MSGLSRSNEVVILNFQTFPERLVGLGHLIDVFLGADPFFLGGPVDFLTVLVGACQKKDVLPFHPLVAACNVGSDRRVRVSQMRGVVYVVDGCGDVKAVVRRHDVLRERFYPVVDASTKAD